VISSGRITCVSSYTTTTTTTTNSNEFVKYGGTVDDTKRSNRIAKEREQEEAPFNRIYGSPLC